MTGSFDGKGTSFAVFGLSDSLVNDVFVASLEAEMFALKVFFDEFIQAAGSDGIGNDNGTGVVIDSNRSSQCNKAIAVNFSAAGVHGTATVNVCIEYNAEVGMIFFNGIAYKFHSLCIFGVGGMAWEHTVGFKALTAFDVCTEGFQNGCIETAHTVTGINDYFKALERVMIIFFGVDFLFNHFTDIIGIGSHIIRYGDVAFIAERRSLIVLCIFKYGGNIFGFQTAVTGEEFQTVSVIGVMACCDFNGTVTFKFNGSHKHGRGRGKTAVNNINTGFKESSSDNSGNFRTGYSGITSNRNDEFFRRFLRFFGKPENKAVCHGGYGFFGEIHIIACSFNSDTSDIGTAFKCFPKVFQHGVYAPLLFNFVFKRKLVICFCKNISKIVFNETESAVFEGEFQIFLIHATAVCYDIVGKVFAVGLIGTDMSGTAAKIFISAVIVESESIVIALFFIFVEP